jgi:hypothetical protein
LWGINSPQPSTNQNLHNCICSGKQRNRNGYCWWQVHNTQKVTSLPGNAQEWLMRFTAFVDKEKEVSSVGLLLLEHEGYLALNIDQSSLFSSANNCTW